MKSSIATKKKKKNHLVDREGGYFPMVVFDTW